MLDRSTRPTCLTFWRASHVARRNVEGNLLTLPPTGRFGDGGGAYAGEREASSLGAFVCRDFDFNWVNAYTKYAADSVLVSPLHDSQTLLSAIAVVVQRFSILIPHLFRPSAPRTKPGPVALAPSSGWNDASLELGFLGSLEVKSCD